MNAELGQLRDALGCAHCGVRFKGSDSQAWKVKYERARVYCSPLCRAAGHAARLSKPAPARGPCPTCRQPFASRTAKLFCSQRCYVASPQFAAMLRANRPKLEAAARRPRRRVIDACLQCGRDVVAKPSRRRRFCGQNCYRAFLADRFDRWVASPQAIALPQNFDEFLSQAELPCLVDGCDWSGHHLSLHMNSAHGVTAAEFKRAAGFNVGSGIISAPARAALEGRQPVGVALLRRRPAARGKRSGYVSLEGREHQLKALALALAEPAGCRCGATFQRRTYNQRFCTRACRLAAWRRPAKGVAAMKGTDNAS